MQPFANNLNMIPAASQSPQFLNYQARPPNLAAQQLLSSQSSINSWHQQQHAASQQHLSQQLSQQHLHPHHSQQLSQQQPPSHHLQQQPQMIASQSPRINRSQPVQINLDSPQASQKLGSQPRQQMSFSRRPPPINSNEIIEIDSD